MMMMMMMMMMMILLDVYRDDDDDGYDWDDDVAYDDRYGIKYGIINATATDNDDDEDL